MIKRMTKITSLLVCAASIMSIVPAMAADIKSYDTQEGTIYNAKAKGSGIYIDGEVNGKDEDVYFMTPDGKYNVLDGVDNGLALDDILIGRYMVMDDGDTVLDQKDNYKVVDGNTRKDLQDDVATIARKVLKNDNDGRFDDNEFTSVKPGAGLSVGGSGLSPYSYKLKKQFAIGSTTIKDSDTVYVDYSGKYVDVDYNLGSVRLTTTGGSVTLKNTKDTYELTETVNGVKTTYEYKAVIKQNKNLTDIGNYVYRWADLSIYKKVKNADDSTYTNVTANVGFGAKGCNDFINDQVTSKTDIKASIPVLEKFSKPTGTEEKIDGIKYAKESIIYFLSDEDGNDEIMHTSDKVILGKLASESAQKVGATSDPKDAVKITGNDKGLCSIYLSYGEKKVYVQNLNLKSKEGFNYIDLGDYDSVETTAADGIYATGGVAYALDGGYVKAWDSNEEKFNKLYKVDGGMNRMSMGSKDFIILWNEDDEIYTIVNNPVKPATAVATTAAAVGWAKATDGTWSYSKTGGVKATSWLQDGNNWYYLNALGVMQTGWINDNGVWYYLNASGAMLANTTVDGYVLGSNGAWIK